MKHMITIAVLALGLNMGGTAQAGSNHGPYNQNYGNRNLGSHKTYQNNYSHGQNHYQQRGFQLYLNNSHRVRHQYNQGHTRFNQSNQNLNHNQGSQHLRSGGFRLYIGR